MIITIIRQSCSNNVFNHWVVPCNCHCCGFLGNTGGSTNPVAQLTLPSPSYLQSKGLDIFICLVECHIFGFAMFNDNLFILSRSLIFFNSSFIIDSKLSLSML